LVAILVTLISGCAADAERSGSQALLTTVSGCDPVLPVCGLGSATLVDRHAPFYPTEAARNGVEGWVDLELLVDSSGAVLDVAVLASDPVGVFDEAAVDAAEQWRFAGRSQAGDYSLAPRVVFDLIN
jgi:TonB family protein